VLALSTTDPSTQDKVLEEAQTGHWTWADSALSYDRALVRLSADRPSRASALRRLTGAVEAEDVLLARPPANNPADHEDDLSKRFHQLVL